MGFYSANCLGCDHSLLSTYSADKGINEWMTQVVVMDSRGSRAVGEYDGYGRVGGGGYDCEDSGVGNGAACWHEACWIQAGRPEFTEESAHAGDQGFFFEDDHDMLEPGVDHPEGALEAAQAARAARRLDQNQRQAVKKALEDASWAVYEVEDKERREEKKVALDALKEEFYAFAKGQPDCSSILDVLYGPEWFKGDAPAGYRLFSSWFESMKAKAQVEWLAERQFEVKFYIPGKTESESGY